jgi:hypothetical protein
MYLKEREDGPFTALISFFRVVLSPHGRGHAVVVVSDPEAPSQEAGRVNAVYADNPDLARYLVDEFVRHFGSFKPVPGIADLPIKRAWNFRASGDPARRYVELAESEDGPINLSWSDPIGEPFVVEYMPEQSATGKHEMFSLFVPCRGAEARVGNVVVAGKPAARDQFGTPSSTAFLAFSETWLQRRG